jgi:hypothetical protein
MPNTIPGQLDLARSNAHQCWTRWYICMPKHTYTCKNEFRASYQDWHLQNLSQCAGRSGLLSWLWSQNSTEKQATTLLLNGCRKRANYAKVVVAGRFNADSALGTNPVKKSKTRVKSMICKGQKGGWAYSLMPLWTWWDPALCSGQVHRNSIPLCAGGLSNLKSVLACDVACIRCPVINLSKLTTKSRYKSSQ